MISHKANGAPTGVCTGGPAVINAAPPAQLLLLPGPINFVSHSNIGLLTELLLDAHLIGIDTETKPSFQKGQYNRTSILQLAIRTISGAESTVIVDLINFGGDAKLRDLNNVLTSVMLSSTVIKIGQGLAVDFKEVYVAYPSLSVLKTVNGVIEINWIYRHLYPEIKQDVSLRKLALSVLNCNLSKKQQCSNWNMRPLSTPQSEYAVRDALILIRLFDVLTDLAFERGDFILESLLGRAVEGKDVTRASEMLGIPKVQSSLP
jgi:ribonuclease D